MFASAALIPPCAATVCERVGKSLLMHATLKPFSAKPTAARRPAPPAPTTTASYVWSTMWYLPTLSAALPCGLLFPKMPRAAELEWNCPAPHHHQAAATISRNLRPVAPPAPRRRSRLRPPAPPAPAGETRRAPTPSACAGARQRRSLCARRQRGAPPGPTRHEGSAGCAGRRGGVSGGLRPPFAPRVPQRERESPHAEAQRCRGATPQDAPHAPALAARPGMRSIPRVQPALPSAARRRRRCARAWSASCRFPL